MIQWRTQEHGCKCLLGNMMIHLGGLLMQSVLAGLSPSTQKTDQMYYRMFDSNTD